MIFDWRHLQTVCFPYRPLNVCWFSELSFQIGTAYIQYLAVSNRVYFLSNNVGIHFEFTYYFPIHPFRLVPMFSGITPKSNTQLYTCIIWDKKPLLCYFTIWTQQLKNQIFSLKASWRYLCRWTLILSNIGLPYTQKTISGIW
jgi:hypothetical protein